MSEVRSTGNAIPLHVMHRVDHYDRVPVLMPNGTTMSSYTPVFENEVTRPCSTG